MVSPITIPCSLAFPTTLNVSAASGMTPRKTLSSQSQISRLAFGGWRHLWVETDASVQRARVGVVRVDGGLVRARSGAHEQVRARVGTPKEERTREGDVEEPHHFWCP